AVSIAGVTLMALAFAAVWWLALRDRLSWLRATLHGLVWGYAAAISWILGDYFWRSEVSLGLGVALVALGIAYRSPRVFLVSVFVFVIGHAQISGAIGLYYFLSGRHMVP